MSVIGDSSKAEVDFPSNKGNTEIFTEFECKEPVTGTYSLAILRPCVKALGKSSQTNIRVNEMGMLSMQHVIPSVSVDDVVNWVEYIVVAQETNLD
jgi:hypothetical protein